VNRCNHSNSSISILHAAAAATNIGKPSSVDYWLHQTALILATLQPTMAVMMFVTVMIVAVIGGGGGVDDDDAPVAESQVRYFDIDGISYFIGHLFHL